MRRTASPETTPTWRCPAGSRVRSTRGSDLRAARIGTFRTYHLFVRRTPSTTARSESTHYSMTDTRLGGAAIDRARHCRGPYHDGPSDEHVYSPRPVSSGRRARRGRSHLRHHCHSIRISRCPGPGPQSGLSRPLAMSALVIYGFATVAVMMRRPSVALSRSPFSRRWSSSRGIRAMARIRDVQRSSEPGFARIYTFSRRSPSRSGRSRSSGPHAAACRRDLRAVIAPVIFVAVASGHVRLDVQWIRRGSSAAGDMVDRRGCSALSYPPRPGHLRILKISPIRHFLSVDFRGRQAVAFAA